MDYALVFMLAPIFNSLMKKHLHEYVDWIGIKAGK